MEELTNKNVSLVITPELELCLNLLDDHDGMQLINALLHTIRGEFVDTDELCLITENAYDYFTGPDYNIKDLILPRLSK